jgi:hypothetical protein
LFYLAGELWRSAIWAICGFLLIAVVAWTIDALILQRGLVGRIVSVAVFCSMAAWLSQYLLARVRVDPTGISRRILWWWDLWSWDEFSAGHICPGFTRHSYESPDRPWYRRTLQLGYLEQDDAETLDALIRRFWIHAPAATIPEELKFRFEWPDRREVQLTARGLLVTRKDRQSQYRWDEVLSVEIWRLESDRRDFRELRLELPGQECRLRAWSHQGQECRNWTGVSADVIAAFIVRHFKHLRLQDFSLHGVPRTLEEVDVRQTREEKRWKESLRVMKWCARLFWGLLPAMILVFPWPNSLFMVGMVGLLAWATQWMYRNAVRDVAMRRGKYETERAAFEQQQAPLMHSPASGSP